MALSYPLNVNEVLIISDTEDEDELAFQLGKPVRLP